MTGLSDSVFWLLAGLAIWLGGLLVCLAIVQFTSDRKDNR